MDYETDIKPGLDAGQTTQQIAAAINVARRTVANNYRLLTREDVSNLLSFQGMEVVAENWLNANTPNANHATLAALLRAIQRAATNADSQVDIKPGGKHQAGLDLALSEGMISAESHAAFIATAYQGVDESSSTVQAAIDQYNKLVSRTDRASLSARIFADDNPNSDWASVVAVFNATE